MAEGTGEGWEWSLEDYQQVPSQARARRKPAGGQGVLKQEAETEGEAPSSGKLVCQVPDCGRDITGLKNYFQRYRICVEHSRQLNITIKGEQCRWCQQCGRFQSVGEFVGANRTCQVRLSKHNERRNQRKALLRASSALASQLSEDTPDSSEAGSGPPLQSKGSGRRGVLNYDSPATNSPLARASGQGTFNALVAVPASEVVPPPPLPPVVTTVAGADASLGFAAAAAAGPSGSSKRSKRHAEGTHLSTGNMGSSFTSSGSGIAGPEQPDTPPHLKTEPSVNAGPLGPARQPSLPTQPQQLANLQAPAIPLAALTQSFRGAGGMQQQLANMQAMLLGGGGGAGAPLAGSAFATRGSNNGMWATTQGPVAYPLVQQQEQQQQQQPQQQHQQQAQLGAPAQQATLLTGSYFFGAAGSGPAQPSDLPQPGPQFPTLSRRPAFPTQQEARLPQEVVDESRPSNSSLGLGMVLPSNDPSLSMDLNIDMRLSQPMSCLDHRMSEQPALGLDRDDPTGLTRPPTDPFDEAIVGRPGSQIPQRPDTAERNRPVPPHLFDALDQAMDAAAVSPLAGAATPSAFAATAAGHPFMAAAGGAGVSAAAPIAPSLAGHQGRSPQQHQQIPGTVQLVPGSRMVPVMGVGGGSVPGSRPEGYSSSGLPGHTPGGDGWQDIDNLINAWNPSDTAQAPDVLRAALMQDPSHSMRDLRMHLSRWSSAPPAWDTPGMGLPGSNNGSMLRPPAVGAGVASHSGAVYAAPQGPEELLQLQGQQFGVGPATRRGAEPRHLVPARHMVSSMPQGPDTDFYLARLLNMPTVEEGQEQNELSFGGASPALQPQPLQQAPAARQRPPQYVVHPSAGVARGQSMHPGSVPSLAQSLGAPGQALQHGPGASDTQSHGNAPPEALLMTYPFQQQLAEFAQPQQQLQQQAWQRQAGPDTLPGRGLCSAPVAFAMQPMMPPDQTAPYHPGQQMGGVFQQASHNPGQSNNVPHPLMRAGGNNDPLTGSGDLSSALPTVHGLNSGTAAHAQAPGHGLIRQQTRLSQAIIGDATFMQTQHAGATQPAHYFALNPALRDSGSLSTAAGGGAGSSSERDRPGSGHTVSQSPYPTGPASGSRGGVTGASQQASGGGQTVPANIPAQATDAASLVGGGGYGSLDHLSASLARLGRAGSPPHQTGGSGPSTGTAAVLPVPPGSAQPYQMSSAMARLSIKLYNASPETLPPEMQQQLFQMAQAEHAALMQGTVRPGCTQFVLRLLGPLDLAARIDTLVSSINAETTPQQQASSEGNAPVNAIESILPSAAAGVLKKLLALPGLASVPRTVIQGRSMVADLQQQADSSSGDSGGDVSWSGTVCGISEHPVAQSAPLLVSAEPPCILLGSRSCHSNDTSRQDQQELEEGRQVGSGAHRLVIQGTHLAAAVAAGSIRVRQRGYDLRVISTLIASNSVPSGADQTEESGTEEPYKGTEAAAAEMDTVELLVEGIESEGLLVVEAHHGPLLSNALQVLVLQSASNVWTELQSLRTLSHTPEQLESVICDLGLLLEARVDATEARMAHAMQADSGTPTAMQPQAWGSDCSDISVDGTVTIAAAGGYHHGTNGAPTRHTNGYNTHPATVSLSAPDAATAHQIRWRDQEVTARLHGVAAALLALCVDWGLPATGRLVLDCWSELGIVHPQQEASFQGLWQVVEGIRSVVPYVGSSGRGLPLPHRAVLSGNTAVPAMLQQWATDWGLLWNWAMPLGPRSITPSQVAAALPDGGAMLHALVQMGGFGVPQQPCPGAGISPAAAPASEGPPAGVSDTAPPGALAAQVAASVLGAWRAAASARLVNTQQARLASAQMREVQRLMNHLAIASHPVSMGGTGGTPGNNTRPGSGDSTYTTSGLGSGLSLRGGSASAAERELSPRETGVTWSSTEDAAAAVAAAAEAGDTVGELRGGPRLHGAGGGQWQHEARVMVGGVRPGLQPSQGGRQLRSHDVGDAAEGSDITLTGDDIDYPMLASGGRSGSRLGSAASHRPGTGMYAEVEDLEAMRGSREVRGSHDASIFEAGLSEGSRASPYRPDSLATTFSNVSMTSTILTNYSIASRQSARPGTGPEGGPHEQQAAAAGSSGPAKNNKPV